MRQRQIEPYRRGTGRSSVPTPDRCRVVGLPMSGIGALLLSYTKSWKNPPGSEKFVRDVTPVVISRPAAFTVRAPVSGQRPVCADHGGEAVTVTHQRHSPRCPASR